jgi:hypothetical protein
MTGHTIECGGCGADAPAQKQPDDLGQRLIGTCLDCGFVTLEHSFADLDRNPGSAALLPTGVSGRLTWRAPRVATSFSFPVS